MLLLIGVIFLILFCSVLLAMFSSKLFRAPTRQPAPPESLLSYNSHQRNLALVQDNSFMGS